MYMVCLKHYFNIKNELMEPTCAISSISRHIHNQYRLATSNDVYIVADTYECHLSDWNKRDFVVSRDTSIPRVGNQLWEIIWGVYSRSISRGIGSNVQTAEEEAKDDALFALPDFVV